MVRLGPITYCRPEPPCVVTNIPKRVFATFKLIPYEGQLESFKHGIITPQCVDKMLSNNTFFETRLQRLHDGLKGLLHGMGN